MMLADWIWSELGKVVDTVFYLPGGAQLYLLDALYWSGLRAVSLLHEQGAGYAALGYAQMRGFGVCFVTAGPGSLNAVSVCGAAWMDSVPMLFISGNAKSDTLIGDTLLRTRGIQEVNIIEIVLPITKMVQQVESPSHAMFWIREMYGICRIGRPGPCWLDVPQDIQGMNL